MIQKLLSRLSAFFTLPEKVDACPQCGSEAVAFIDVSWTMGPQAWACFDCDWIDV